MKTKHLLLTAICMMFAFSGQAQIMKKVVGNNKYETEVFKVSEFTRVNMLADFNVVYQVNPDSAGYVSVYAEENILDLIEFETKKGKLDVKFKTLRTPEFGVVLVRMYSKSLTEVENLGAGIFEIRSNIDAPELIFTQTGSGQIKALDTKSGVINVSVGGSGDVIIGGKAGMGVYSINGSGEIDAKSVKADEVNASITGGGEISCYADKNIKTFITGSGIIKYDGDAEIKSRTVGSGRVIPFK